MRGQAGAALVELSAESTADSLVLEPQWRDVAGRVSSWLSRTAW
ncbi:hypothetical protein [Nonomuraea fuscirosea]